MNALSLQFIFYPFYPKTLKNYGRPSPPPLSLTTMKDRPRPSSYGSVYIPPHQRLRSVITSAAAAHDNISPAPVDSKSANNQNSFVNPKAHNPYPYLHQQKQHQQQQQKKNNSKYNSAYDEVSEEGSDHEIEQSNYSVRFSLFSFFVCSHSVK